MTSRQKELISATVPVLREHGVALTAHFYNRMFTHHPELKNLFNLGNQQSSKPPWQWPYLSTPNTSTPPPRSLRP